MALSMDNLHVVLERIASAAERQAQAGERIAQALEQLIASPEPASVATSGLRLADHLAATPATVVGTPPYLTCEEAAVYLRTTKPGIYSLVKRGRLKPMPGSGKLLFTREALDDCLKMRRR
jgi:excisionase family DNA binding protein